MKHLKKLILILPAFAACLMAFALSAAAYTTGDVDNNGKVAAADARLALRAAVRLESFWNDTVSDKFKAADVDRNGKITAADARLILRVAVKLDIFPAAPAENTDCAHVWAYTANRTAKGVVTGTHTAKCSKCGQTKTENCAYGAKVYTNKNEQGVIITKPTCTKAASYTETCTLCKGVRASVGAAALNHKNKKLVAGKSKAATCTEAGWNFYACPDCGLDGSTTDKKAKAVLYVTVEAKGHVVSGDKLSADKDIVCSVCGKAVSPSFNSLVNAIKKNSGLTVHALSKDVTNMTVTDINLNSSLLNKIATEYLEQQMGDLQNNEPVYGNYYQTAFLYTRYPLRDSAEVSRLKDADLKSLNVKEVTSVDFLNELPDTITYNNDPNFSLADFKALGRTTGTINKITVELIDEKYSAIKNWPAAQETALQRGMGIDIRAMAKSMETELLDEANEGSDDSEIDMTLKELMSSATITYYFLVTKEGTDTVYTPLAAKYEHSFDLKNTVNLNAPVQLISGSMTMNVVNSTTDYYIFTKTE